MEQQQSLFSERLLPRDEQAARADAVERLAAHMAQRPPAAAEECPEDRTSQAARDQGWGPVDLAAAREAAQRNQMAQADRLFELPGRERPNPYDRPVNALRAQHGLSADQIAEQRAINQRGLEEARKHLPPPREE